MRELLKYDEQAILSLRKLYTAYGYQPYKMSRFEEYDLYIRNKDFLISQQVITFPGKDGRLLALKPDVTLSIIKNSPEEPGVVQKLYYNESVYRTEKNTGVFKELMQAGLECVGDLDAYEITEVMCLAVKSLQTLRREYILDISHMGLVEAVLEGLDRTAKGKVIGYLQQKNLHELQRFCREENLGEEVEKKLQVLLTNAGKAESVLQNVAATLTTDSEKEAFAQLESIFSVLQAQGLAENVRIDFSVGNDMRYYNGVVFQGYLEGVPEPVLSGGQYDRLPQRMGRKSKAIGFAIYLDLLARLQQPQEEVDAVLLYDETADLSALTAAVAALAEKGSVLAAKAVPEGQTFCNVYRLENGEAILFENA